MNDSTIKLMVSRFLGWKLPENFSPDGGVRFKATYNEGTPYEGTPYEGKHRPSGTNLLSASQAEAMVRHMVEGLVLPVSPDAVTQAVLAELQRATAKFPTWPTDPLHALGVVHEEVGELSKEVLQLVYEPHKTSPAKVREEAIQAAAMALRFAMSLDVYLYTPGSQHSQSDECMCVHGGPDACIVHLS